MTGVAAAPPSSYRAPWWGRSGHVQTIAAAFRRAPRVEYSRERIGTADGDFLDLDWCAAASVADASRLVVISYGMESDSSSPYVRAVVSALRAAAFDVLVWNFRGCSGEPNRKKHFYHAGLIADLEAVVDRAQARGYRDLSLAGFSLGGNLTLNYLGHRAEALRGKIRRAAIFSAPLDLAECAQILKRPLNRVYDRHFLSSFRRKLRVKTAARPELADGSSFSRVRTLEDYDRFYTAPHFGFASVAGYYRAASCRHVLPQISIPTLIVNAEDDPFLGPLSFPDAAMRKNANITFESPRHGGHLGFLLAGGGSWMEQRLVAYFAN